MEQKSIFNIEHIYPSGPQTERGQGTSTHIVKNKMVYCSSNLVIIRNLDDFENCEMYKGHREQVTCAKLSPNGNWVCSADEKGNVHIWDALGKEHVARYVYERYASGSVNDIAWTSDNQRVAIVGDGKEVFAKVFLIESGSKVGDLNMIGKKVLSVDIRRERPFRLATAGEEFSTNWYEGPPYKWKQTQKHHTSFVNCLRFSPDGSYFVTVSSDRKIVLYNGKEGTLIKEFSDCHQGGIWYCDWISATQLATCSGDKTIKIWEIKDMELLCVNTLKIKQQPTVSDQQVSIQSSEKAIYSLSLGGCFNIFENYSTSEAFPSQIVQQHSAVVNQVVYAENNLISADKNGKILIWDDKKATIPQGDGHTKEIISMSLSANKKFLFSLCRKGEVKMLDIQAKQFIKSQTIEKLVLNLQAVGDSSLYLLLGDEVQIWNEMELTSKIPLEKFEDPSYMAVSENGVVAIGNHRGKIIMIKEGNIIHKMAHLEKKITCMKFSEQYLISGDSSGQMKVWDIQTGEPKTERWSFHSQMVQSINIIGNKVVTSSQDNKVIIWNLDNFEKECDFPNVHTQGIYCSCIGNDGYIYTGGSDWLIKKIKVEILSQK